MEAPPRPDMFGGGGESFKMAALLSEWCETTLGIEPQQRIRVTCYTSTRTQCGPREQICKCYVTYLLIEW